jgi:hypothetical protein
MPIFFWLLLDEFLPAHRRLKQSDSDMQRRQVFFRSNSVSSAQQAGLVVLMCNHATIITMPLPLPVTAANDDHAAAAPPAVPPQAVTESDAAIAPAYQEALEAGVADSPDVNDADDEDQEDQEDPADQTDPAAYMRQCESCGHLSYARNRVCFNVNCAPWLTTYFFVFHTVQA